MKRHSPWIPGLEPGIKQRDQLIAQSGENGPSTKVYCKGVVLGQHQLLYIQELSSYAT
jgi:hypothetical protein